MKFAVKTQIRINLIDDFKIGWVVRIQAQIMFWIGLVPHLLFSLESLANLARNGRVKPAVAAVARMLNIRVIGKASDVGELDVLCKTRGEHGALERIVLELKGHGYTNGKVIIAHCGNPAAAERLMHMVRAVFEGAQVRVTECGGLCSYYAELGGLMVGFEDADA